MQGNVVGTGHDTLQFGGDANPTASFDVSLIGSTAQYRGFASFVKTGASTWTLSGNNTAALPWSIDAGTLLVNGTLANSTMSVNNGGTLGGVGTVGATTVNAGGIFAPGAVNTPGTSLAVNGNLAFQSGALYLVSLGLTANSANVTGTATLTGANVVANFLPGGFVSKTYKILTAAGGLGSTTFSGITNVGLPAGASDTLSYDADNAYLNLTAPFGSFTGLNRNQQNVANALANFFNANGGIPMGFFGLSPAGLTQVSGEGATGSQQATFNAMSLFMGVMTDPFISGRGDVFSAGGTPTAYAEESMAYAAGGKGRSASERNAYAAMYAKAPAAATFEQRWSVWAAGFGGSQTTDGNAVLGSNNASSSIYGTAVGADYRFSPDTLAGFALAGGGTSFNLNGLGYGRSDLFQAGAFVRHNIGAAYVTGALAYGWQDITTDRFVTVAGLDHLRAEFNANAYSGRVESGYRFVVPTLGGGLDVTPYAAGQFTTFDLPAYAEAAVAGSPLFALSYASKSVTDTRSELGLRTDKSFAVQNGIFTLRGRLAWAHDFDPDRSIAATFQTLPGASFIVNGAALAADSALTTASAEWKWTNGWSAAATLEGEFSSVTQSYAGKGVIRYVW